MKLIKFLKKTFDNRYLNIYKHAKKLFVFDIILLILAISLFGISIFWFFWTPSIASKIELNFAYSSEKITSGQDLDIFITYANNSKFNLENTSLSLNLPSGFILNKAKNEHISDSNSINLGQIKPSGNGKITISGQLIGDVTQTDKILATLTYKIGKTSKIDQKNEMGLIKYTGSEITGQINIQESSFPDKEIPFTIKLTNLSQNNIDGLTLELPNYAKISKNTDKIDKSGFFSLSPEEEVVFEGVALIPKTIGNIPFSYSVKRNFNGKNFIQHLENSSLKILSPDIGLKLNPQIIKNYLDSGENLKLEIYFQNLSGNILQNQSLILEDVNEVLDLPFCAQMNNIEIDDNKIIIGSSARTIFSDGTPSKLDLFTLNLKLKNDAGSFSSLLKLIPIFSAELFDSEISFSTTGENLEIYIPSLLITKNKLRYYTKNGDQVGRGPLPPQVGLSTKYWSYIDIQNGANELTNFKLIAKPGTKTTFTGKQSVNYGDEMMFSNNEALWQQDSIPAFTSFGLYFETETIPTIDDLGKNLTLIKELKIEATDKLTGKKHEYVFEKIINKLESDDEGSKIGSEVVR